MTPFIIFITAYWKLILGGLGALIAGVYGYKSGKRNEQRKQLEADLDRKEKIIESTNKVIKMDGELMKKLAKAENNAKHLSHNDYAEYLNGVLRKIFKPKS